MDATFQRAVLGQPALAAIVFEFEFGVYEDVRPAFRACNELVEFDDRRSLYVWDASFHKAFAPDAAPEGATPFHAPFYPGSFTTTEILGVLKLLLAHGALCHPVWMKGASTANNVPVVRFLHEHPNNCCHPKALEAALKGEAWDVADFLLANCTAKVSVVALQAAVRASNLDVSVRILQRQPELRHGDLLALAIENRSTEVAEYLLDAGIGKPRECLIEIAGRRNYGMKCFLLLRYCMSATDHIANVTFLLDLLKLPDRHRVTTLRLVIPELIVQGQTGSQTVQLPRSVMARVSTLLQSGKQLDGVLPLVIGRFYATATTDELMKWTRMVHDADLTMQLHRLLSTKPRNV